MTCCSTIHATHCWITVAAVVMRTSYSVTSSINCLPCYINLCHSSYNVCLYAEGLIRTSIFLYNYALIIIPNCSNPDQMYSSGFYIQMKFKLDQKLWWQLCIRQKNMRFLPLRSTVLIFSRVTWVVIMHSCCSPKQGYLMSHSLLLYALKWLIKIPQRLLQQMGLQILIWTHWMLCWRETLWGYVRPNFSRL